MRSSLRVVSVRAVVVALVAVSGWMAVVTSQEAPASTSSLEGLWSVDFGTALERSPAFGTRELLTDAERDLRTNGARDAQLREETTARRVHERGSDQDVNGGYQVLMDAKPASRFTSLVIDPPDGRIPPYTPEAAEKAKVQREFETMLLQATTVCKNKRPECVGGKYGPVSPRYYQVPPYYVAQSYFAGGLNRASAPEDMDLRTRCLAPPMPNWNGPMRIVQSKNSVSMVYEGGQGQNPVRVIPITDRPHAPSNLRFWGGDSRAHWEGDTLVVDVTNFDPRTVFPDDGGYAGRVGGARENLHLIEKFKRIDAKTLQLVVTIDDPSTWTRPWTIRQEFSKQDEQKNEFYYEPRCHEGNFGLPNIMSGARQMDRDFRQGKGADPATTCIAQCGGDHEDRP